MSDDLLTPRDEDDFLAAEYALGLSEGEALVTARSRAERDPDFARLIALWQERLVAMTDSIAPRSPRKRVRRALLARLFPKQRAPLMERLWVWKGLTLMAVLAFAWVAIPNLRPPAPTVPTEVFATQMRGETGDLELIAVLDPARGDIALRRLSGEAPAGRVLELWAILPEQDPISLGVLPADESARVALPAVLVSDLGSVTLAITDEPQGGSPTGAPTGTIRAVGAAQPI
ncbi:MAG: anti-sigma factor [Sulfitobacter sp.]|nr:anti-sigma factor [Sulfitobacter sp.]